MKTKTLLQIINEGYQFPEIIPTSLQNTILDWFALRHVSDDDNFSRYFDRVLKRDYHRYNELLRIEAGVGDIAPTAYDWLVNSYLEKESITDMENQKRSDSQEVATGSAAETYTPRVEKVVDSTVTDTYGKTETVERDNKRINSGSDTTTTTYGRTDTTEANGHENSGTSSDAISTATGKATPASVLTNNYNSGNNGEAYARSDSNQVIVEMGSMDVWNGELASPSSISQAVDHSLVQAGVARDSRTENTAGGEDINVLQHGQVVSDTDKGTTTHGGSDVKSGTVIESFLGENTTEKENNSNTKATSEGVESGSTTTREIYTGRNGENMATALTKAKEYIQSTSAWEWFRIQLEPCFMAVYDI